MTIKTVVQSISEVSSIQTSLCPFTLTEDAWDVTEDATIGVYRGVSKVNGSSISACDKIGFEREYQFILRESKAIQQLLNRCGSYREAHLYASLYAHDSQADKHLVRKLSILAGKERMGIHPFASLNLKR